MAVNTFLKISETCKEEFVISHTKEDSHHHHHHHHQESEPYIDELIRKIPDETNQLEPEHKLVFYEAVGHMISCEKDFDRKNYLLQGVLGVYWEAWENMLREIEMNIEVLKNEAYIEQFVYIIRVHERLAYSVGHDFYKALAKIYMDLLKLYTLYSQLINSEIEAQGAYVINYAQTKRIRALKREMLGLIETFIEKSNDNALIAQNFIPPLSDVLQDYASSIPDAREAEVLSLFTAIVEKLTGDLTDTIPKILDLIFGATLQMITTDFNSYHDHRVNLFKFLNSIANHCFQALFNIPPEQFKTVIDCVLWAIKHELPAIFEVGLNALETILNV
jgi:Importin beta-related nuclear transport receptor